MTELSAPLASHPQLPAAHRALPGVAWAELVEIAVPSYLSSIEAELRAAVRDRLQAVQDFMKSSGSSSPAAAAGTSVSPAAAAAPAPSAQSGGAGLPADVQTFITQALEETALLRNPQAVLSVFEVT